MSLVKIKQISNQSAASGSVIAYDGTKNVWQKIRHSQIINFSDLDLNGSVSINHGIGQKYVQFSLYDENDKMIMPDDVHLQDPNTLTLSLHSFGNSVMNWHVVIS